MWCGEFEDLPLENPLFCKKDFLVYLKLYFRYLPFSSFKLNIYSKTFIKFPSGFVYSSFSKQHSVITLSPFVSKKKVSPENLSYIFLDKLFKTSSFERLHQLFLRLFPSNVNIHQTHCPSTKMKTTILTRGWNRLMGIKLHIIDPHCLWFLSFHNFSCTNLPSHCSYGRGLLEISYLTSFLLFPSSFFNIFFFIILDKREQRDLVAKGKNKNFLRVNNQV